MRQIFLDTETTGLDASQGDRIIEIGCIEMVDRRYTEGPGSRFHHYVNPQRSSHPDAVRVHGITDEFLADKPLFADIAQDFLAFVKDAEIVIHNAAFDRASSTPNWPAWACPRCGSTWPASPTAC
jgi:DNA polymerase III subunit epsilon